MPKKPKKKLRRTRASELEEAKARLNLLINGDLKKWAHNYAERKHTSVTALITSHFIDLREKERDIDVEQI